MILKPPKGAMLNRGHPLARGLVGCWLMNEGGGKIVNDLSGNGNIGSLVADAHFVAGKFGPALDFDGTGDYVNCGSLPIMPIWTVSAWARTLYTPTQPQPQDIFSNWDGTNRQFIEIDSVNSDRIYVCTTNAYYERFDGINANDGLWHHHCYSWDGTTVKYYYDNVLQTAAFTGDPSDVDTKALYIWARSLGTPDRFFNGQIDNVMIYNRALSASEILHLYRNPFCMFEVDL